MPLRSTDVDVAHEHARAVSLAAGDGVLVSVIVNNYNYARFLGTAIASALAQTYLNTEVVVVDDGSTDSSAKIAQSYGSRIILVLKKNGGQGSAFNEGFTRSSGQIVIFLDSDDYLFPTAVEEVVAVYRPDAAKVHYRLTVVSADGQPIGQHPPPDAPLHDGDVVPILLERGHYTTPVGSGNAYSRSALERVLPVPEEDFRYGADGYVIATVPFYGSVIALNTPLAAYRFHGNNYSGMPGVLDVGRFHYAITHHNAVERAIARAARDIGVESRSGLMLRYPGHVEARISSLRMDPSSHPIPGDRRIVLTLRGIVATWRYADVSIVRRVVDTAWFVGVGSIPRGLAEHLIAWKYVRSSRPRIVQAVVRQIRRWIG